MNEGRGTLGAAGTQTAAMAIAGNPDFNNPPANTNICEIYNGTSWASTASMANPTAGFRGTGGTTSSAYAAGGFDSAGNNTGRTEEFTGESSVLNVVTVSTS